MQISITDISKVYGNQKALNQISLDIDKGEIVALLGPNGAGKSTLMKCLTGSVKPNSGNILIGGNDINTNALLSKKLIGFLPENNPLYPELYVKEYLSFVAALRKINKSEVDDVIEKVGLTPEKSKKIKSLSKGFKQRVGIAQAIIHKPEILILDEPTNGLDPNQIIEIRNLIKNVGKNKTIILSTHIMQEVSALCTRVILLNKGEILADQAIEDFQGNYKTLEEAFYNLTIQ